MNNNIPVEKNKIYRLKIDSYTHDGNGVGKIDGYAIFVPYSVANDELDVLILKATKTYAYGKIVNIINPSPSRVVPNCPVFEKCGGCQLMHISYDEQLNMKRQTVVDAMKRIGGFENIEVKPVIGAEQQFNYRNKAQYPIGLNNSEIISGFYAQKSHKIIPNNACLLQHETSDKVVDCVKNWMNKYKISAYSEEFCKGIIRHVYTRVGFESKEVMVVVVSTTSNIPHKSELVNELISLDLNIKSVIINMNNRDTNVVLGKENTVLFGSDKITDSINGIKFLISSHSFYQVNPAQTKILYQKAIELAQFKPTDIVFDIYCGIGTISLFAAKHCKEVHGIEIVPEAINDAQENAKINNIKNALFYCGDAANITAKLKNKGINPNVVIIDPPRKGCDDAMIELLTNILPKRIVYVSCNPSTLSRDMKLLAGKGFRFTSVQPVDMFPNTGHVECCVLLYRNI